MKPQFSQLVNLYRAAPSKLQDIISFLSPVSINKIRATYIELRSIPIQYGEFSTSIMIPVDRDSPWKKYDRRKRPFHEPLATETYIKELDQDDTFWDIGSRHGYESTIAAANVGAQNVHVFEADDSHAKQIQRLNDIQFNGKLTLNHSRVTSPEDSEAVEQKSAIILDEYAETHGNPDFVKMDIEGAEADAAHSLRRTIRQSHPTMLIEVHPNLIQNISSTSQTSMLELLTSEYDTCLYCQEFRELSAEWLPFDENTLASRAQVLCKISN